MAADIKRCLKLMLIGYLFCILIDNVSTQRFRNPGRFSSQRNPLLRQLQRSRSRSVFRSRPIRIQSPFRDGFRTSRFRPFTTQRTLPGQFRVRRPQPIRFQRPRLSEVMVPGVQRSRISIRDQSVQVVSRPSRVRHTSQVRTSRGQTATWNPGQVHTPFNDNQILRSSDVHNRQADTLRQPTAGMSRLQRQRNVDPDLMNSAISNNNNGQARTRVSNTLQSRDNQYAQWLSTHTANRQRVPRIQQRIQPAISQRSQSVRPVVSQRSQSVQPIVSQRSQSVQPVVSQRSQSVQPVVSQRSQSVRPVVSQRAQSVRPVVSQRSQSVQPVVSQRAQSVQPVVNQRAQSDRPVVSQGLPIVGTGTVAVQGTGAVTGNADILFEELVKAFTSALQTPTGLTASQIHNQHPQSVLQNRMQHGGMLPHGGLMPHGAFGNPMLGNPYGFMNPWMMGSSMMQEMMFGDTTDPPDHVPTTTVVTPTTAVPTVRTKAAGAVMSNVSAGNTIPSSSLAAAANTSSSASATTPAKTVASLSVSSAGAVDTVAVPAVPISDKAPASASVNPTSVAAVHVNIPIVGSRGVLVADQLRIQNQHSASVAADQQSATVITAMKNLKPSLTNTKRPLTFEEKVLAEVTAMLSKPKGDKSILTRVVSQVVAPPVAVTVDTAADIQTLGVAPMHVVESSIAAANIHTGDVSVSGAIPNKPPDVLSVDQAAAELLVVNGKNSIKRAINPKVKTKTPASLEDKIMAEVTAMLSNTKVDTSIISQLVGQTITERKLQPALATSKVNTAPSAITETAVASSNAAINLDTVAVINTPDLAPIHAVAASTPTATTEVAASRIMPYNAHGAFIVNQATKPMTKSNAKVTAPLSLEDQIMAEVTALLSNTNVDKSILSQVIDQVAASPVSVSVHTAADAQTLSVAAMPVVEPSISAGNMHTGHVSVTGAMSNKPLDVFGVDQADLLNLPAEPVVVQAENVVRPEITTKARPKIPMSLEDQIMAEVSAMLPNTKVDKYILSQVVGQVVTPHVAVTVDTAADIQTLGAAPMHVVEPSIAAANIHTGDVSISGAMSNRPHDVGVGQAAADFVVVSGKNSIKQAINPKAKTKTPMSLEDKIMAEVTAMLSNTKVDSSILSQVVGQVATEMKGGPAEPIPSALQLGLETLGAGGASQKVSRKERLRQLIGSTRGVVVYPPTPPTFAQQVHQFNPTVAVQRPSRKESIHQLVGPTHGVVVYPPTPPTLVHEFNPVSYKNVKDETVMSPFISNTNIPFNKSVTNFISGGSAIAMSSLTSMFNDNSISIVSKALPMINVHQNVEFPPHPPTTTSTISQPEVYRTLQTILDHNPAAIVEVLTGKTNDIPLQQTISVNSLVDVDQTSNLPNLQTILTDISTAYKVNNIATEHAHISKPKVEPTVNGMSEPVLNDIIGLQTGHGVELKPGYALQAKSGNAPIVPTLPAIIAVQTDPSFLTEIISKANKETPMSIQDQIMADVTAMLSNTNVNTALLSQVVEQVATELKAVITNAEPKYTAGAQFDQTIQHETMSNIGSKLKASTIDVVGVTDIGGVPIYIRTNVSTGPPVLANVEGIHIKREQISSTNYNSRNTNSGSGIDATGALTILHSIKSFNPNASAASSAQSDIAKKLSDPNFVNILRGLLKGMMKKADSTTPVPSFTEMMSTAMPDMTSIADMTTLVIPVGSTEEYEAEDYPTTPAVNATAATASAVRI